MKTLLVFVVVGFVSVSSQGLPPGFNLTAYLISEGVDPSTVVSTNCIPIDNPCTGSGKPCCFSPVFACQPSNMSAVNTCNVIPRHVPHIPLMREIFYTYNVTTQQPLY